MGEKLDLVGKRFGRLVVIKKLKQRAKNSSVLWQCLCDCGRITIVRNDHLQSSNTRSCGCLQKEIASKANTKHGMWNTPIYYTWQNMLQRCNNPKHINYQYYGGREIKVCKQWLKFENFFIDMGKQPMGLTIERINNALGYLKENCKWATWQEQGRNRRISKNNTSGCRGVYWQQKTKKYCAQIGVNRKIIYLGSFINIKDAIAVRKAGEQKYWNK